MPNEPDWSVSLRALIVAHRYALRGSLALSHLDGLGPLTTLWWDRSGWRPDWLAKSRSLLTEVLDTWSAGPAPSDFYRGVTAAEVAQVVELVWGTSCYPYEWNEAGRAVGISASEGTIREWVRQIRTDGRIHRLLAGRFTEPATPRPATPPRYWRRTQEGNLPAGLPEAEVLLRTARRTLGIDPEELTELELQNMLRACTAVRADNWFGCGQRPNAYDYWRQLTFAAIRPWSIQDAAASLYPVLTVGQLPSGRRFRDAVAATLQMIMFEVAEDAEALIDELALRDIKQSSAERLYRLFGGNMLAFIVPALSITPDRVERMRSQGIVVAPAGVASQLRTAPQIRTARDLLSHSYAIRGVSDPITKRAWIRAYLAARPRILEAAGGPDDELTIALADQGVGYDCVLAEDEVLVERMAAEILQRRTGARLGYRVHAFRDRAVVHNKHNRFGFGDYEIHRAELELDRMRDDGQRLDPRETLESLHQLWLSAAGLKVRRLENYLDTRRGNGLLWAARDALRYSGFPVRIYDQLDHIAELGTTRHVDGYISTKGWQFQSLLIRLRVLLAVRLGVEAGLLRPNRISNPQIDRRDEALPPPATWREEITAARLEETYRTLVMVKGQHERPPSEFVRMALTYAFLNGGRVPWVGADQGGILTSIRFLDGPPYEQAGDTYPWLVVPMDEAALWLHDLDTDAGLLTYYRRDGPAYRTLEAKSEGSYSSFVSSLIRPRVPSHD